MQDVRRACRLCVMATHTGARSSTALCAACNSVCARTRPCAAVIAAMDPRQHLGQIRLHASACALLCADAVSHMTSRHVMAMHVYMQMLGGQMLNAWELAVMDTISCYKAGAPPSLGRPHRTLCIHFTLSLSPCHPEQQDRWNTRVAQEQPR